MHTRIKAFTHGKICKRKRLFQTIIDSSNFTFQQFGIHNDIIGWNDFKVENIQAVVTEQGTEFWDGRNVIVTFPDVTVEVRKDEIDIILGQPVERTSFDQDAPQIGMIVLDPAFLPGSIGVTVENPCPKFSRERTGLNRNGVRKFRTIVSQNDRKHFAESFYPRLPLCQIEVINDWLGVVRIPQISEHHAAIQQQCQQDFPADAADDGIHLDHG